MDAHWLPAFWCQVCTDYSSRERMQWMSGAYRRTHALSQPCVHPSRSSVQSAGRRDESIREHSLSGHSVSLRQKVLKLPPRKSRVSS